MRVLHIVPKLSDGGVARVVLNYWEKIDKNNNDIVFDFITHEDDDGKLDNLISQGCKIFYCKTIGKIGLIKYYKNLKAIIKQNEFDIIHIHIGHLTGVYAYMCKRSGANKIICHAHTTTAPNQKHQQFMPILRKLAVKNANSLVACGKNAGEFCFGDAPFIILGNGLDYDKITDIGKNEIISLKNQLNLTDNDYVLGNVADFNYLKNHRFLIDVFSNLLNKKTNLKLILVGGGTLQTDIIEYVRELGIQDNVLFLGQRNDVYKLLYIFDVFLLPSLHEGMPVSVIEAQSAGIPCILSDAIDRTVDFNIGLTKFLDINNVDIWVEELQKTQKQDIDKDIIKEALIKSGFDINTSVHVLIDLYHNLANNN